MPNVQETQMPPRHIAIIMDGNGRWAKQRGLPRTAGHKVGAEAFRTIANYAKSIGLQYLTVYAFSTENWKRPEEEVDAIMDLLEKISAGSDSGHGKESGALLLLRRSVQTFSSATGGSPFGGRAFCKVRGCAG